MTWTTTPPTEPGWYWIIFDQNDPEFREPAYVYRVNGVLMCLIHCIRDARPVAHTPLLWWPEKLDPPPPPEVPSAAP